MLLQISEYIDDVQDQKIKDFKLIKSKYEFII